MRVSLTSVPGDLIMVKANRGVTEHAVTRIITPKQGGCSHRSTSGFTDGTGADIRIGTLCGVVVLRKGTHHTLAASI